MSAVEAELRVFLLEESSIVLAVPASVGRKWTLAEGGVPLGEER